MVEIKLTDPRRRFLGNRTEEIDLIIPQFIYDANSIGDPPEKEVTFSNLNDNVNKKNLEDMCKICGRVEEIEILYHPITKRHTGLAKAVFRSSRSARMCVEKYNNISKMGNIMSVKIDILGKLRAEMYNNIINPPIVSQSEVEAVLKPETPPFGYYTHELQQSNFVISSDDVVRSKTDSAAEEIKPFNSVEADNVSEYSEDSNGQKYSHGNSVVSSSLDPSRMVASSLTNEPLEPLDIRIQKLLTGTSLCTESTPKQLTDNNDISSSTEPFQYEEAISHHQNHTYSSHYSTDCKRSRDEKPHLEFNRQVPEVDNHRSRHSSKGSNSYHPAHRYLISKSPPKKLTDHDVEKILDKLKQQFIEDLKETLHRDICKKMIETTAYGSFHNWWDFKENEHKSLPIEKIEPTESVAPNSVNETAPIRPGERSMAFKSQLSHYTGLPKIKRLARPISPKLEQKHTHRSPSNDKHQKHGFHSKSHSSDHYNDNKSHRDHHHKYSRHNHHSHHDRDDPKALPFKPKYVQNDGFVSETDDSDFGISNQDKSVKQEVLKVDKVFSRHSDDDSSKINKVDKNDNLSKRRTVDKVWESSEDDTDKTETMAMITNQENKTKVKFEKLDKDSGSDLESLVKLKKQTHKADKKISPPIIKKVIKKEVLKEKIENKAPKKAMPVKSVKKVNRYDTQRMEYSSSGSESDDEDEDVDDESESRSSSSNLYLKNNFLKKKFNKASDNDSEFKLSVTTKKATKRVREDSIEPVISKKPKTASAHLTTSVAVQKKSEVQVDTPTYELEMYFHDIAYWNQLNKVSQAQPISLSFNILTNQHKQQSNNRCQSSVQPSRRKQTLVPHSKEVVNTPAPQKIIEAPRPTVVDNQSENAEEDDQVVLENFIDGPYSWDEIVFHDHQYFQMPAIGTSISYKSTITKSEFKSHRPLEVVPIVQNEMPPPQSESHPPPSETTTDQNISEIFSRGIDAEDLFYLQDAHRRLCQGRSAAGQDEREQFNAVHWVDEWRMALEPPPPDLQHLVTGDCESRLPVSGRPLSRKRVFGTILAATETAALARKSRDKSKRIKIGEGGAFDEDPTVPLTAHSTGSARTQGFYRLTGTEKRVAAHGTMVLAHGNGARMPLVPAPAARYLLDTLSGEIDNQMEAKDTQRSQIREARNEQRRLQTEYQNMDSTGELLRINHLGSRKKLMTFAKSGIHSWGLVALEPIAPDEMVIEYVGQVIRRFVSDHREKQYQANGIGSSYLFRIDDEWVIDATMYGSNARFINHSCQPNCIAKVIIVDGKKKIVIYSKHQINVMEEITYDYKFPYEEDKIPCLCGSVGCRGTLN